MEELLERLAISPIATILSRITGINPQLKSIIPTATDIAQTSITLGLSCPQPAQSRYALGTRCQDAIGACTAASPAAPLCKPNAVQRAAAHSLVRAGTRYRATRRAKI